ncbi:MAG: conjugal transfer protein TraO, partial [Muribaculum sp.]|nr:conjugal transfer protein TraO [Muribaculum sp.]
MKKFLIATIAMLSHIVGLTGVGPAMAQRCLPGMSAVEVRADMVDGFYTGNSRDCGYSSMLPCKRIGNFNTIFN